MNSKGTTFVELMITVAIFSIIVGMVYSVYNSFLKHATAERRTVKAEMDIVSVAWPFMKEIQSAGFGVPRTGSCSSSISVSANNELIIHSTASGDHRNAGRWSYTWYTTATPPTCNTTLSGFSSGENNVVIINSLERTRMDTNTVKSNGTLTTCKGIYNNHLAYWIPYETVGDLECYETRYSLRDYSPASERPGICAPATMKLSRSVSRTTQTNYQHILDCVFGRDAEGDLGLNFRFGCIDSDGNLEWKIWDTNVATTCPGSELRFVRIGLLLQGTSRRDLQVPGTITLFEDLDTLLHVTINLTDEQRYYRWRKVEQTIALRNLE